MLRATRYALQRSCQGVSCAIRVYDAFYGAGGLAVPIPRKVVGYILYHCPYSQKIEIDERHIRTSVEIFVADIAPPSDRCHPVDRKRLVVHSPVEPEKVEDITQRLEAPHGKGVINSNVQIGVSVQLGQNGIEATDSIVVQQKPYLHPAVRSFLQSVEQQQSCKIIVPDIILRIDGMPCGACKDDPGRKRRHAIRQGCEPGTTCM